MKTSFFGSALVFSSDIGVLLFQSSEFDHADIYCQQMLEHLRTAVYVLETIQDDKESADIKLIINASSSHTFKRRMVQSTNTKKCALYLYLLGRIANEREQFALSRRIVSHQYISVKKKKN